MKSSRNWILREDRSWRIKPGKTITQKFRKAFGIQQKEANCKTLFTPTTMAILIHEDIATKYFCHACYGRQRRLSIFASGSPRNRSLWMATETVATAAVVAAETSKLG